MSTETETKPLTYRDLRKFCGEGGLTFDDRRPFALGGFCWATDACILVRVPYEGPDSVPRPGEVKFPDAWIAWNGKIGPPTGKFQSDGEFVPLLPDPAIQSVACWVCDSGRYICNACDDDQKCPCCYGVGKVYWPRTMFIGTAKIQTRYYELIRTLPNPTFVIPGPGDELNSISFRFDGGEGLLMPLAKEPGDGDS